MVIKGIIKEQNGTYSVYDNNEIILNTKSLIIANNKYYSCDTVVQSFILKFLTDYNLCNSYNGIFNLKEILTIVKKDVFKNKPVTNDKELKEVIKIYFKKNKIKYTANWDAKNKQLKKGYKLERII